MNSKWTIDVSGEIIILGILCGFKSFLNGFTESHRLEMSETGGGGIGDSSREICVTPGEESSTPRKNIEKKLGMRRRHGYFVCRCVARRTEI